MKLKTVEDNIFNYLENDKIIGIIHQVNCFSKQQKGFAKEMSTRYDTHKFRLEGYKHIGKIEKLGNVDYEIKKKQNGQDLIVVNCYSQYHYGIDKRYTDYNALGLCIRKIDYIFKDYYGAFVLPHMIGCGLAGGKEEKVKDIIEKNSHNIFFESVKKIDKF